MKLVLITCAVAGFVGSSFAGGSAQWNPVTNRWEYRDDSGSITGSSNYNPVTGNYEFRDRLGGQTGTAHWNPVTNRWEYRD
jgi:hypothetical protein